MFSLRVASETELKSVAVTVPETEMAAPKEPPRDAETVSATENIPYVTITTMSSSCAGAASVTDDLSMAV